MEVSKTEDEDILELSVQSDITTKPEDDQIQKSSSVPKHLAFPVEKNREDKACDFLLPYAVESVEEMDEKLETIISHLIECAEGKDFQFGFVYWNGLLQDWLELRYPMRNRVRARLAGFYYNLACTPGMEIRVTEMMIKMAMTLLKPNKNLDIRELQLDWEPLYALIEPELFPKQRATNTTMVYTTLLSLAEFANPYFPPHATTAILEKFLPLLDGSNFDMLLAAQSVLCLFLPIHKSQEWIGMVFRLWATFQSGHWDEQWLDLLARLSFKHIDPTVSDPRLSDLVQSVSAGEDYEAAVHAVLERHKDSEAWIGVRKDIGIFTEKQWKFIIAQCIRFFQVPLGAKYSQVSSYGASETDTKISAPVLGMLKPSDPLESLAQIIIYSMSEDSTEPSPTDCCSKALSSVSKLLTSMETFFHPSNHGEWSSNLAKFLRHLSWQFTRRWTSESKLDCPTPGEWRLTARLRKQFVAMLKNCLLMSMFTRDGTTSALTQVALKIAADLEPGVIVSPIVELSVAALEGLLETHRTTACLVALSAIIGSMLNSIKYPSGARNLPTILDLLLPGIDPSDPSKTMHSAMLVLLAVSRIKISDVMPADNAQGILSLEAPSSNEDVEMNDTTEKLTQEDVIIEPEESSTFLSDWALTYFRRVLSFFENLPEPHGTREKTGGKIEESTITFLVASFDELCKAASPALFPSMLNFFKSYICDNVRFNMVKAVGLVASSLARGFADSCTLRCLFPVCDRKIRTELEGGASGIYTMAGGSHRNSDLELHWFSAVLIGAVTNSGPFLIEFKDEILALLKLMIRDCKTEKGYAYASRLLYAILRSLLETYPNDNRFVNPDEWNSPAMRNDHRFAWGKTYKFNEVKISWHVASQPEIDFAMSILEEILMPVIQSIKEILNKPNLDHDTKCEFVKFGVVAKSTVSGIAALAVAGVPAHPGEPTSDWWESIPTLPKDVPTYKTGIPLSPSDKRHARVLEIKQDLADVLHQSVLKLNLFDETIECFQSILGCISSLLLDYPFERGIYDYQKETYKFVQTLARVTKFQKEYPRIVWLRRAQLLHFIRLRTLKVSLRRSKTDDQLIHDVCQFCVSSWVAIRKSAQRSLEAICGLYDGSRSIILPSFLKCLDPGTDPDKTKGALYVLGGKSLPRFCSMRPELNALYVLRLLQCQHCEKPSIQALVNSLLYHHSTRISETFALCNSLVTPATFQAIEKLNRELLVHQRDPASSAALEQIVSAQKLRKDECERSLVRDLLKVARDPSTHWKYTQNASRVLSKLIRRDQPLDPQTALYFINELCESDLPAKRSHAVVSITKILHFIKLRTMTGGSEEALLIKNIVNPLAFNIHIPAPADTEFEKFSSVVATPLKAKPEYLLDKVATGWLVCGDVKAYHPPPEKERMVWDPSSESTLEVFKSSLSQESFWKQLAAHLTQETSRDYLSADNVIVIKSIFQIFRLDIWPIVLPILEGLLEDPADRHKQRAAGEIIGGALRATKHWPLDDQNVLWDWFDKRLKSIYHSITPDSLGSWVMCVDYILLGRDPRRNQVLIDFIWSLDTESHSSAFKASKAHQFIGSGIRCLTWPFMGPPIEKYWSVYWRAIGHDYLEVRNCVGSNLQALTELMSSPSFSSVNALLATCQDPAMDDRPLSIDSPLTIKAIDKLLVDLRQARQTRLPAQHGDQEYDRCSTTIITWLWCSMTDFVLPVIYPFIPRIVPELLYMHELTDNKELSGQAHTVVLMLSCVVYPQELAQTFLETLLDLSKTRRWKVRLDVLTILRAFFFHQLHSITRLQIDEILQTLCILLGDSSPEVREAAAETLCGIVHCSERASILQLKSRFTQILRETSLPKFRFENGVERLGYQATIIKIHSAVLGSAALVNAFPYEVPAWVPEILINNICSHMSSPAMISTTARTTLTMFKKTHQDTWIEGQKAFSPEDLATLNDYLVGSSYYA